MLKEYQGNVTVKIDGLAASAASVIAMAGDTVLMSPVSMLMIHNPATIAAGDHNDMQKAIDMLSEVKESIINAYVMKSGLSRAKLSHLMEAETWMNANKAVELGLADGVLERSYMEETVPTDAVAFSRKAVTNTLMNKLTARYHTDTPSVAEQAAISMPEKAETELGCSAADLRQRLDIIEKYI